jgi:hypothetical protein
MLYRGWKISAHPTYLGFFAQFTSPLGQPHQTSSGFLTDEQAIAYARSRIDSLIECQWFRFESGPAAAVKCL